MRIDGSYGEGGGQILRSAVALSALTGKEIEMVNIRSKRDKPGLAAQHLTGVRGVAELCGAEVEGASIGSTRLRFRPGPVRGGSYELDVGTAGSITLVLQACLLASLHADAPVELVIRGGTNVRMSPPVDYYENVFLPFLHHMGLEVEIEVIRRGFYPQGGGEVRATLTPPKALKPLVLEERGRLEEVGGTCFTQNLPEHVAERMNHAVRKAFLGTNPRLQNVRSEGPAAGAGTFLYARYGRTVLGADALGERGVLAERVGEEAAKKMREEMEGGGTLDVHAADQLLAYMALASGPSTFLVREVSLHLTTQMWLLEQLLDARFKISDDEVPRVEVLPNRT